MGLFSNSSDKEESENIEELEEHVDEPAEVELIQYKTLTYRYSEHDAVLVSESGTAHQITFDRCEEKSDKFVFSNYTEFTVKSPFRGHKLRPSATRKVATVMKDNLFTFETTERREQVEETTIRNKISTPASGVRDTLDNNDNIYKPVVRQVD